MEMYSVLLRLLTCFKDLMIDKKIENGKNVKTDKAKTNKQTMNTVNTENVSKSKELME